MVKEHSQRQISQDANRMNELRSLEGKRIERSEIVVKSLAARNSMQPYHQSMTRGSEEKGSESWLSTMANHGLVGKQDKQYASPLNGGG